MNKVGIIYWSGTGNTEQMATCIAEGAKESGGEVTSMGPGDFSTAHAGAFDVLVFGCPSMGAEQLEESEFEPMFAGVETSLGGRKVALFGSYGWGDGQWMREWCDRCRTDGAQLFEEEGLIVNETPDDAGKELCRALGRSLAGW